MFEGILIGVASTVGASLVLGGAALICRVWHTPKRLDRLERLLPPMVRAVLVLLRTQKTGSENGELDNSIHELEDVLSDGAISQKASR